MIVWIFLALLCVSCLLALWLGGAPERLVAGIFVLAWLASKAVPRSWRIFAQFETMTLAIDILLLVALLLIALKANRRWPMAMTSLQAIIVLAHLAKLVDPQLIRPAYAIMTWSWPFLQLLLLIIGTLLHARRVARTGAVASWSSSSGRRPAPTPQPLPDG